MELKDLIKFVKWVGRAEHLFVVVNTVLGHTEPVLSDILYKLLQSLTAVQSHWDFLIN